MRKNYIFYIYILASSKGTLYVGVTNNLPRRIDEHKNGTIIGFSKKYCCNKLVYYETYQYVYDAFEREKQLKNWNRKKKEFIINKLNPHWNDLSNNLF